jgi:hypothetical protein
MYVIEYLDENGDLYRASVLPQRVAATRDYIRALPAKIIAVTNSEESSEIALLQRVINALPVRQNGNFNREMWYNGHLWYSSGNSRGKGTVLTEFAPGFNGYYREYTRVFIDE